MMRDYYLFWRPGLGYVKDSMYQYAEWSYSSLITVKSFAWDYKELVDYTVIGVKEHRKDASLSSFVMTDGGIFLKRKATVYDIRGSVLFYGDGFVKLKKGVYFVREGDRTYRVIVR